LRVRGFAGTGITFSYPQEKTRQVENQTRTRTRGYKLIPKPAPYRVFTRGHAGKMCPLPSLLARPQACNALPSETLRYLNVARPPPPRNPHPGIPPVPTSLARDSRTPASPLCSSVAPLPVPAPVSRSRSRPPPYSPRLVSCPPRTPPWMYPGFEASPSLPLSLPLPLPHRRCPDPRPSPSNPGLRL
jgi:hypothetical protein